jgi:hypothetical protein
MKVVVTRNCCVVQQARWWWQNLKALRQHSKHACQLSRHNTKCRSAKPAAVHGLKLYKARATVVVLILTPLKVVHRLLVPPTSKIVLWQL